MDDSANHRHHMDILASSYVAVWHLYGQQGDIWQRLLRGDMAARDVQKGEYYYYYYNANQIIS